MMRKLTTLGMVGVLALGAFAFDAPPEGECRVDDRGTLDDTTDDADLCTVAAYLSCADAVGGKVQALPPVAVPNAQLVAERPTTSFTAGGGCGEFENSSSAGVSQDNIHDFTFQGFIDANIDSLTVELHDFNVGPERGSGEMPLGVRVAIDGASPFGFETISSQTGDYEVPRMVDVVAEAIPSSTGLTESYVFTITGIGDVIKSVTPGDGKLREVKITINTPIGGHVFVWGATEVPAGVLTNPVEPLGTVLTATG